MPGGGGEHVIANLTQLRRLLKHFLKVILAPIHVVHVSVCRNYPSRKKVKTTHQTYASSCLPSDMRADVFHKLWEMLSKYSSWKDPLPAVKYSAGTLLPKLCATLASRVWWKEVAAAQPTVLHPSLPVQPSYVSKRWLYTYVRIGNSCDLQSQCIFVFLKYRIIQQY